MCAPRPASLLGTKDNVLTNTYLLGALTLKRSVDSLVGAGIDVEKSVDDSLRTKLNLRIVPVQHEYKVVVVNLIEVVEILRCTIDFR